MNEWGSMSDDERAKAERIRELKSHIPKRSRKVNEEIQKDRDIESKTGRDSDRGRQTAN